MRQSDHSVFKHFKGGRYVYLHRAWMTLEKGLEPVIVYLALATGGIYVRPEAGWNEVVKWPNGAMLPRFIPWKDAE